jgi:hypothetical protein
VLEGTLEHVFQNLMNEFVEKKELLDSLDEDVKPTSSNDVSNNISCSIDKKDDLDDVPSSHALLATNALLPPKFEKHTRGIGS